MSVPDVRLFGSPLRTAVLVMTGMLEETYPRELATILEQRLFSVQRIVNELEREGILASRRLGVERRVTLNPGYVAYKELRDVLTRIGNTNRAYMSILSARRRRPRRAGKPITRALRDESR